MVTCCSSSLRMSGMLMQLAAATAVKGTRRPTKGGILFTMEFSPRHHTVHVDWPFTVVRVLDLVLLWKQRNTITRNFLSAIKFVIFRRSTKYLPSAVTRAPPVAAT